MLEHIDYEGLTKALIALITALAGLLGLAYRRLKMTLRERRSGNVEIIARLRAIEDKLDKYRREALNGRRQHSASE